MTIIDYWLVHNSTRYVLIFCEIQYECTYITTQCEKFRFFSSLTKAYFCVPFQFETMTAACYLRTDWKKGYHRRPLKRSFVRRKVRWPTVWKNEGFTPTEKIFCQITSLVIDEAKGFAFTESLPKSGKSKFPLISESYCHSDFTWNQFWRCFLGVQKLEFL